jgi:hypothetical protein
MRQLAGVAARYIPTVTGDAGSVSCPAAIPQDAKCVQLLF